MNPLKFIDQIKDMYNDQDPGSTIPGPRNMYSEGQLVTPNVDGSRPGYSGPKRTNPYLKDKDFLKFAKEEYGWTPDKPTKNLGKVVLKYERQLAKKGKVFGTEGLIEILGNNNPYTADTFNKAFGSAADMTIKKNMSAPQKTRIKMAQKIRKILVDNIGEPKKMKEVYAPFKYLSKEYKKVPGSTTKVWEINKKQIKALNKELNRVYQVQGMQADTIDNIYNLFDDIKFMEEIKNYDGKAVDIDSYMFKKVFEAGKGGKNAYAYMQLGRALQGKIELEGIKVDKALGNKIVKSIAHKSSMNIDGEMGKAAQRYAKLEMGKWFDNPNSTYKNISESITKAFRDAGMPVDNNGKLKMNIDEIFPARTGQLTYGKGSGVHNHFVQFIDSKINQKAKRSFDGRMSKRLQNLDSAYRLAKGSGDYSKVEKILAQHEKSIKNFYIKNPEAKGKVNLTKFHWDAKNKKFLKPEQVFESQYKGSYKTIPEKIRKGMEKFHAKTGISIDPGTARTLEAAQKEITTLDKKGIHKFLKQAGFNINKCLSSGGRVKLQGGGGLNTCIRGVIEEEQAKAMKGNKISKAKFGKFGKLARIGAWFLGPIDIPIELGFALPHMLSGDKEAAKRATTAGLFGWGKSKMDEIKAGSDEGYKYAKHMKDTNDWMDAWFNQQNKIEELKTIKEGTGAHEFTLNQLNKANEKMNFIDENYKGYYDQKGEYDAFLEAKGKSAFQDYLRKDVKEKTDVGMPIRLEPFSSTPYNWAPFKGGQPITNLKQWMDQKGETYWRQLKHAAYEAGVPKLFDNYFGTADVKDPRDAYTELPTKYASELGNLEKQETLLDLKEKFSKLKLDAQKKKEFLQMLEEQGIDMGEFKGFDTSSGFDILGKRRFRASGGRAGYMGGGIAAIRKPHAIPPLRQGLRSIMINDKDN